MTPETFIREVWGGLHSLAADGFGEPSPFRCIGFYADPLAMLEAAERATDEGRNVWFGVHPLRHRPAKGRGKGDDVAEVRVLVADLDWDNEYAHKTEPGALPTEAEVRSRLARFEHPPTFVVNSGHGLQAYWKLATPVDPEQGHELTLRLHAALEAAGMPADRADLASVLRVPGTYNVKPGCDEVLVVVEQASEAVYQPEYLAKRLPAAMRTKAATAGDGAIVLEEERHWWADGDIGQGKRHKSLVAAAGWCHEMGLRRDEAIPIIRDVLARHRPAAYSLDDALARLDDVYRRYPAGDRLAERRERRQQADADLRVIAGADDHFEIRSVRAVADEIDAAGTPRYLIRRLVPDDAYGVLGAEKKAGKTWLAIETAVAVASGAPWLGAYEVDRPGPVLAFFGEGGKRKMLRRLRAVGAHKGVAVEDLPIRLCFRAPHLTSADALAAIRDELGAHPAVLVIVDPLYLAARGANASQLNEMGAHLEAIQHVAQDAGAALLVVHHWNKTGQGSGSGRMSGAGAAEWGRFLISASVVSKRTEHGGRSVVTLRLEVEGDETPELDLRLRRTVWVDDPDDLASPMHYEAVLVDADQDDDDPESSPYSPSERRVLAILEDATDWLKVSEIGDRLADEGRPLKKRTIQKALKSLEADGLAVPFGDAGRGEAWSWRAATNVVGGELGDF